MTDLEHRVGVRESNLVVRNLRLSNVTDDNINTLIKEIDQLFGLDGVSFNQAKEIIHLAYDAANLNLDGIEQVIKKHGVEIHDDWWTHTKESYYKFCDENVKETLNMSLGAVRRPLPEQGVNINNKALVLSQRLTFVCAFSYTE